MTSVRDSIDLTTAPGGTHADPPSVPAADPTVLGLPVFIIGSLALGLALVGFLPSTATAGILPVVLAATGLGLMLSTVWAMAVGQTAVAAVFGIFMGFWLSYAALLLGLTHGWYAIAAGDIKDTVGTFLLCWTVLIGLLTVATLRLPSSFSLLFGLVTLALALVTAATYSESTSLSKLGGYVVLAFALDGVYLFLSAASASLGGAGYPLGRPLQH